MNSLVLSDAQRAAATDPVVRQLIPLIPRANFFDADGTPRFVGSAPAVVDQNRWTVDVRHNAGEQRSPPGVLRPPAVRGDRADARRATAFPGSASVAAVEQASLTVNETHIFGAGAAERSALRPEPPGRRHVSGARRSIRWTSGSGTASRGRSGCRR